MDKIVIDGGHPLKGHVKISGSKNAALPLLAASLLTAEKLELLNVPDLVDIRMMLKILGGLGVKSNWLFGKLSLATPQLTSIEAPYDLVRKMRASIVVLGPLLARSGRAKVSLPGGCAIGARPVNLHIKALEQMGAKIHLEGGYIHAQCKKLRGEKIVFDQVTVTGTENIMMAAVLAEGHTLIENAACEPEVVDLAEVLHKMGARIRGAGTSTIEIEGVTSLSGAHHTVIPDRIEAGTFMIAAAMNRGNITLDGVVPEHLDALTEKLKAAGTEIDITPHSMRVRGAKKIAPVDVKTAPYPGFATDFQAQLTAMMCLAEGSCIITESIFENRFMHVLELNRMGADLRVEGNSVHVKGVEKLLAAPVMATDLRASASLVLAALAAKGVTDIHRVYHIDRGYFQIEKKFRKLGARIKRAAVKY